MTRCELRWLAQRLSRSTGDRNSTAATDAYQKLAVFGIEGSELTMRVLLIAIPTMLVVGFGAWAVLVLVVLEH